MLPEAEAQDLIAQLERASQRSRPYVIFGLVAIVAGFVILAGYLEYQRRAAEALAAEQTERVKDLTTSLNNAKLIASEPHAPESREQWERMKNLLALATGDVASLKASVSPNPAAAAPAAGVPVAPTPAASAAPSSVAPEAPATSAAVAAVPPPPSIRLFIQIADASQRDAANRLASSWAGGTIDGITVVVPGVQLVRSDPENTIRCTQPAACARLAPVAAWVNGRLASPQLKPIDISRLYGSNAGIRPGTYELWFGPGEIVAR